MFMVSKAIPALGSLILRNAGKYTYSTGWQVSQTSFGNHVITVEAAMDTDQQTTMAKHVCRFCRRRLLRWNLMAKNLCMLIHTRWQVEEEIKIRRYMDANVAMLVLMEIALTLTLMPFVVVVFLDYGGILTCDDISQPYLITFYVLCSNSIMNVLLYSFRDRMFVRDLKIVCRVIASNCQNMSSPFSSCMESSNIVFSETPLYPRGRSTKRSTRPQFSRQMTSSSMSGTTSSF